MSSIKKQRLKFHKKMESLKCPACKTVFLENKETCTKCNFPFNGTEQEKAVHIGQFILKKGVVIDASDYLKKTQNILFTISGVMGIYIFYFLIVGLSNTFYLIVNISLAVTFLFCGYKIKNNPTLLIIIPLFLVIGIFTINHLINPIDQNFILNDLLSFLFLVGSLIYCLILQKKASKFKGKYTKID